MDTPRHPTRRPEQTRGWPSVPASGTLAQTRAPETAPEVSQLPVGIRPIRPRLGRRLLVRSDSSLAALHATLPLAFGWTDAHLHRFRIHGRDYGPSRVSGPGFSRDARPVRLDGFQFGRNERFLSESDFRDSWRHAVRVERWLSSEPRQTYPVGIGGRRAAPPEDRGGPWAFLHRREGVPGQVREHLERVVAGVDAGDADAARAELEALESLRAWLTLARFARRLVNSRLRQFAAGAERWRRGP